ncbi:MAG: phosphoribosylanthranilate isomerase [Hyphomicrobiales bacterium]|nr:phosphoribosylanthranilate isomerase [Hyphomicrobiales bacterium]
MSSKALSCTSPVDRGTFLDGLDFPPPLRAALASGHRKRGPVVKICGLSTPATLRAALGSGADLVGFVFFAKSPRNVSLETAEKLAELTGTRAVKVALTVDADDHTLAQIVARAQPDMLQLHGHESPARVAQIRAQFGLPVIKAIGVSSAADLKEVAAYSAVADRLLFDAKPPAGADLPGGNGLAFDWQLLRDLALPVPFMLSGGLDAENVAEAARQTGAAAVDVSSGVETAPGRKDATKITAFIAALRRAPGIERLGSEARTV